jgi:hypothetical protein
MDVNANALMVQRAFTRGLLENDVDVVPLAAAARRRTAEVAAEIAGVRLLEREEIADRGDGDIEIDRSSLAEHALRNARRRMSPISATNGCAAAHLLIFASASRRRFCC